VQSAVRYLASGGVTDGNLSAGSSIRLTFDDAAPDRKVTLMRPDGKMVKLDVVRLEKQAQVRYSDTDEPGQYRLEINEPGKAAQTVYYIVHSPIDESNLTQLTPEKWSALEKLLGLARVDPSQRPIAESMADNRQGTELWAWALSAVLALVALEMLIARVATVQRKPMDRTNDLAEDVQSELPSFV
jgi:hypothetical protein